MALKYSTCGVTQSYTHVCVLRTAQSMLSYLAFLGADVSAFVPFCPAQFIVPHIVYICTVLFEQINDDDDDD